MRSTKRSGGDIALPSTAARRCFSPFLGIRDRSGLSASVAWHSLEPTRGGRMKGSDKPKKLAKKAPQKTLKERRSEKRAAEGKRCSPQ